MEEIEFTYRNPRGPKPVPVHERWQPPSADEDYPWIPVRSKPVDIDPNEFNPRKGIMTRYGKKLLEEGAKYYGKVSAEDIYQSTKKSLYLPRIKKEYPSL